MLLPLNNIERYFNQQSKQSDWNQEEGDCILHNRNLANEIQIRSLNSVEHDSFDPPGSLFEQITNGKRRLFLHNGPDLVVPLPH